jgi:3,4-dihydroxy 2-butanone 4-phosphate synthase/GTP cyclohydrolase II
VFGGAKPIHAALAHFQASGSGVLVYLRDGTSGVPTALIGEGETGSEIERKVEWREVGLGAQILRDLNVGKMKLLARPRKMPSMTGFGLQVTGYLES